MLLDLYIIHTHIYIYTYIFELKVSGAGGVRALNLKPSRKGEIVRLGISPT